MPLIRPTALRSLQSSLRYSGARATARAAPARTQLVARRWASSGGHGDAHGEASSDIPWIIGALVITPPSCWYLWPDTSHAEHHDDHGAHEEHDKPNESEQSKEDEQPQEEAAPAEQEGGEEKAGEEEKPAEEKPAESEESKDSSDEKEQGKDEQESGSDDKGEETEAEEQTEGKGNVGKGKMAEDSAGQEQTRKLESQSESRGANKKRLDSGLGKNLGTGPTYEDDGRDAQAQSKPPGSKAGDISQKQKGLSNTDTRHSIQIDAPGSEKSTKGSGGPETAKHKGTVDSSSPLK